MFKGVIAVVQLKVSSQANIQTFCQGARCDETLVVVCGVSVRRQRKISEGIVLMRESGIGHPL